MFEAGIAKAGMLRIPATPELVYDFLPVVPRTIQHGGVEVGGLAARTNRLPDPGQNTRVKLLKRTGYGRANFDLLRKRILLRT